MMSGENGNILWFRRVMWAGILANFALGAVSIAFPAQVLEFLKLPQATPLVWPRFSCFLLILMSLFYIAAARDPVRNSYAAKVAVLARFGGVLFFGLVGGRYMLFGLFDFVFGLPQALLLMRFPRGNGD
jgi:hypothetical protein